MADAKTNAVALDMTRGWNGGIDARITLADGMVAIIGADDIVELALAELNRRGFTLTLKPGQKLYRASVINE